MAETKESYAVVVVLADSAGHVNGERYDTKEEAEAALADILKEANGREHPPAFVRLSDGAAVSYESIEYMIVGRFAEQRDEVKG